MLAAAIVFYLLLTLGIGLWAAGKNGSTTRDFVLAGQKLPLALAASATFATWFGAESILGAPAEFVRSGLLGVVEDPFGAALCLLLVGLFFVRKFYALNILTFCDYFRIRYGRTAEFWSAVLIIPSYFSWIAAQLIAMGIIMKVVTAWSMATCVITSSAVVMIYTIWGGMWSVSVTDFFQTLVIIAGMVVIAVSFFIKVGGVANLTKDLPDGFFRFYPEFNLKGGAEYVAAWITIGLGSIPQQDVFQRVMAARTVEISVKATLLSSLMYLTVGLLPLFIGLCAHVLYGGAGGQDQQMVIPDVIRAHTSLPIQILFFGALLSAILSTTSSAVMAPAVVFGENIVRFFRPGLSDRQLLLTMRCGIVLIMAVCIGIALTRESIFELVGESSAFSLVSLFVPLTAGLYWRKANLAGCLLSMTAGLAVWLFCAAQETTYPPLLYGLLASLLGMAAGVLFNGKKN